MLRKLLRKRAALKPPNRVLRRVVRWAVRAVVYEYAWFFAIGTTIVLAAALALGLASSTVGIIALVLLAALDAQFLWIAWLGLRSAASVRAVLEEIEEREGREPAPFPTAHVVMPPLMLLRPRGVSYERGVEFARVGKRKLRLDVYKPDGEPSEDERRPAIVQVHGGGWVVGTRSEQGIPLLNHLAANGWVGFNIDYRLSPSATAPDHVIDVKRAIAWVREHADEYAIDPDFICITGGSAGGHLCALAALTANQPELQPGFEGSDTSVAAAVPFYGIYDVSRTTDVYWPDFRTWLLEEVVIKARFATDPEAFKAFSPIWQVHEDAPPFLIFHGDRDSLIPVIDAQDFVEKLRGVSKAAVLYAELHGAEHAFDIGPSVRTARVVETIERFLDSVRYDRAASEALHSLNS